MEPTIEAFDWNRILLNDLPAAFLLEVLFRTLIIFLVVLVSLRITGKRGVRELSVFELIIILTLGSAAGDISFYEDVPLLPVIAAFVGIIGLYMLITLFISKSDKAEELLEGKPLQFIEQGQFIYDVMIMENIASDELIAELRVREIEHLGQVKTAILETSGKMSIFKYPETEIRPGMPTLPRDREMMYETREAGFYACARCAYTSKQPASVSFICQNCDYNRCMKAMYSHRES